MDLAAKHFIGLGIAGNFAGHLEQAKEADDFVSVQAKEGAPKGIFPFYIPEHTTFLGTYPLSHSIIRLCEGEDCQVEPETALLCRLHYSNNIVDSVEVEGFCAYNDCSIRRPGAPKISHKKNWGENTKGVASHFLPVETFSHGGDLHSWRLASFLRREGKVYAYGVDSPLEGYSYFYDTLLEWITHQLVNQEEHGPLENIHQLLTQANFPEYALISIGATRYTPFGEETYLQNGDEIAVILYDSQLFSPEKIANDVFSIDEKTQGISLLRQRVVI